MRYPATVSPCRTDGEFAAWRINQFETPAGSVDDPAVTVHVLRVRKDDAVFTVTLINTAEEAPEGTPRDLRCLFQMLACSLKRKARSGYMSESGVTSGRGTRTDAVRRSSSACTRICRWVRE